MKNKEIDVQIIRLEQAPEANAFVEVPEGIKTIYSDLIVQIAKTGRGNEGVGDLEEQVVRMDIIKKAKAVSKGKTFNFSREEIKLLQETLGFWKLKIVDNGLIEFQRELKDLKPAEETVKNESKS